MMTFIVERCIPPEVLRQDVHGRCDVVAVSTEQHPPYLRVVIAETLCVFSMQGEDVRPDVAGVVLQF